MRRRLLARIAKTQQLGRKDKVALTGANSQRSASGMIFIGNTWKIRQYPQNRKKYKRRRIIMIKKIKDEKNSVSLLARILELDKLIDYQEGSIVSRAIISKKSGNITIFAFDKGQGLSEHTAPFDALVYIIDGQAEVIISGKKLNVGTDQMVIMPANKPHALNAKERFKMALIMIKS
jgi:quercetin dioxygenase-like cupin family protein